MKIDKIKSYANQYGIELDVNKRWEKGIPHHPKSEELMTVISEIDYNLCNDYFGWKIGGDGDNGESLMFEMDIYFELKDKMIDIV